MYKPVDVDAYLVRVEKGLQGTVYVAVAMGRIPSEQHPKVTFFIIPPMELEKEKEKYKGNIKLVDANSDEFKRLKPELRRLARIAARSPSSYVPDDLVEELVGK